jgi:hypothetical protein
MHLVLTNITEEDLYVGIPKAQHTQHALLPGDQSSSEARLQNQFSIKSANRISIKTGIGKQLVPGIIDARNVV